MNNIQKRLIKDGELSVTGMSPELENGQVVLELDVEDLALISAALNESLEMPDQYAYRDAIGLTPEDARELQRAVRAIVVAVDHLRGTTTS